MVTTVAMAAANSTAAGLPREVLKWVQSLDLSYSVKNVRRAFNNGFLVAEIFSRYFPQDISMHGFSNTENYGRKRDNWQQLQLFFYKRKIPIVLSSIDALILNEQDTTLEFVKQIYTLLTERQLMPPVRLYENQTQDQQTNQQTNRDLMALAKEDDELEKENEKQAAQEGASLMGGPGGLSTSKSPHKSLAIKGPPKVINETLEIDNYKGVKVTDINVKNVVQSVAQLRAQKEMSSIHSNAKLDTSSAHDAGLSQAGSKAIMNSASQNFGDRQSPSHGDTQLHGQQDGYTTMGTGQGGKPKPKTITEILHDRITAFVSQPKSGDDDFAGEFSRLKIENDMVNTFFDEINKFSDSFVFNFIETLKQDIETIIVTLFQSPTEVATFYTFLTSVLKRLSPVDGSFTNTLIFCKTLAARIYDDPDAPSNEFNKFFTKHLFKSYCQLIKECSNKRQQICELIFAHCAHDLQLRIKIVQSLKKHLQSDELVYACQAHLLALEEEFNEQWFDVFLYYALIGLSSQQTNIRVCSLNILTTIARNNCDSMLEVAERVSQLADEKFWEIKAQCLEFATTMLMQFKTSSHLLAHKDDIKAAGQPKSSAAPGEKKDGPLPAGGKPGSSAPGGADRNQVKNALNVSVEIVRKCFNINAPMSVQKLGLFSLQPLLNDYKLLYASYVEVLVNIEQDIKNIILSPEKIGPGEEIYFSLGSVSFNYKLKQDLSNFDMILLANALIDNIIANNYESLEKEHIQLFMVCCSNKAELEASSTLDSWLKVFQKLKDYLLVSICNDEICQESILILHNFLTADQLKYSVYQEVQDVFVKSLELLYRGDTEPCKEEFREYMLTQVVTRTVDTDNALKKFFKGVLQQLQEQHSAVFASSNLVDVIEQLDK